jgi:hypothetical protein
VSQDLFGQVDQRVGAALPGGAPVVLAGSAGQRFEGGQQRLAVLGGEAEPSEQAPVRLPPVGEVPLVASRGVVGVEGGFAVRRDLVGHPPSELRRVQRCRDGDQVRLGLDQRVGVDLADQAGQDGRLRRGEDPVQDGGGDEREFAEQRAVRSCAPAVLAVLCCTCASHPATVRGRPVSTSGTLPPDRWSSCPAAACSHPCSRAACGLTASILSCSR